MQITRVGVGKHALVRMKHSDHAIIPIPTVGMSKPQRSPEVTDVTGV